MRIVALERPEFATGAVVLAFVLLGLVGLRLPPFTETAPIDLDTAPNWVFRIGFFCRNVLVHLLPTRNAMAAVIVVGVSALLVKPGRGWRGNLVVLSLILAASSLGASLTTYLR